MKINNYKKQLLTLVDIYYTIYISYKIFTIVINLISVVGGVVL